MSDPRAVVDFEGTGYRALTYTIDASTITFDATKANGSAQVGLAVMLSADATIALTQDASAVLGRLERVHADGKAVVQVEGGCTLPGGASATLTAGTKIVGALGASSARGYIRTSAATAGEAAVARHRIEDGSTATAVKVTLG